MQPGDLHERRRATHPGQQELRFHMGGADPVFFESTRGLRGYKGSVYEGGLRVPVIARLPRASRREGSTTRPGCFADWFPTLAEGVGCRCRRGWTARVCGRC